MIVGRVTSSTVANGVDTNFDFILNGRYPVTFYVGNLNGAGDNAITLVIKAGPDTTRLDTIWPESGTHPMAKNSDDTFVIDYPYQIVRFTLQGNGGTSTVDIRLEAKPAVWADRS